jgi:hypothetical protein
MPRTRATVAMLAAALGLGGCATVRGLSGDSVFCGDTQKLTFRYAELSFDKTGKDGSLPIWSGTRRAKVGEPIGVTGSDMTDMRLVTLGGASTGPRFEGGIGSSRTGSTRVGNADRPDEPDTQDWVVDVFLSGPGAEKLQAASQQAARDRKVLALLIGEEVFSVSVQMDIRGTVARIELPARRDLESARTLFTKSLACPAES